MIPIADQCQHNYTLNVIDNLNACITRCIWFGNDTSHYKVYDNEV